MASAFPSTDAQSELQKLLYDTLKADAAVMALANDVYDAVPPEPWGAKKAYISFGPSDVFNEDPECLIESTHTVQIDCWSRQVGSVNAKRMVDAVYAVLHDNSSLTLSTNALVQILVTLRQVMRDPDGLTTHGVLQVEVMIEERSDHGIVPPEHPGQGFFTSGSAKATATFASAAQANSLLTATIPGGAVSFASAVQIAGALTAAGQTQTAFASGGAVVAIFSSNASKAAASFTMASTNAAVLAATGSSAAAFGLGVTAAAALASGPSASTVTFLGGTAERIVATNGRTPGELLAPSAGQTGFNSRFPIIIARDCKTLKVCLDNWIIDRTSFGTDVLPPSTMTIVKVALESVNLTQTKSILFSGVRGASIAPGATLFSDALLPSAFGLAKFTRGEKYFIRISGTVPTSSDTIPVNHFVGPSGAKYATYATGTAVDNIDNTGALPPQSGETNIASGNRGFGATAIIGQIADASVKSWIGIGDSIMDYQMDTLTPESGPGWLQRASFPNTGFNDYVPTLNMARYSARVATYSVNLTRKSRYYPYCDAAIESMGVNDISQGRTAAQVYADKKVIWQALQAANPAVVLWSGRVGPYTTSTDNWTSVTNQTYHADVGPGSVADQLRTLLLAAIGGDIAGVFDHVSTSATTDKWKWKVPAYTSDGLHPLAISQTALALEWRGFMGFDITAPTITSAATASVPENAIYNFALSANETVTWSIVGGADQAKFSIAGSTLTLPAKNFEGPDDANADGSYLVTVRATDASGNTADQAMTLTLTNVNEAPTGVSLSNSTIVTASAQGTTVGTLNSTDPDAANTFAYSFVAPNNNAGGRFQISGSTLQAGSVATDIGTATTHQITVRSTDQGGLTVDQSFTITVTSAGAVVQLDFVADTYRVGAGNYGSLAAALASGNLTFARSGAANYEDASGAYSSFATNTLRRGSKGALIEDTATNLCAPSSDLSAFTLGRETITVNQTNDPLGNLLADLDTGDGTTGNHTISTPTISFVNGTRYVFSAFVKAGTDTLIQMCFGSGAFGTSPAPFASFSLVGAGSVVATLAPLAGYGIRQLANGWYKIWTIIDCIASTSNTVLFARINSSNQNTRRPSLAISTTLYFAMVNVVADSKETSPIDGAATRAADALGIVLPSGTYSLTFTFDDNTTQTISGITGGSTYTVPVNLNRPNIKTIVSSP